MYTIELAFTWMIHDQLAHEKRSDLKLEFNLFFVSYIQYSTEFMYVKVECFFSSSSTELSWSKFIRRVVPFLYQLYRYAIDNSSAGPLAETTHKTSSWCHQYSVVPEKLCDVVLQ